MKKTRRGMKASNVCRVVYAIFKDNLMKGTRNAGVSRQIGFK